MRGQRPTAGPAHDPIDVGVHHLVDDVGPGGGECPADKGGDGEPPPRPSSGGEDHGGKRRREKEFDDPRFGELHVRADRCGGARPPRIGDPHRLAHAALSIGVLGGLMFTQQRSSEDHIGDPHGIGDREMDDLGLERRGQHHVDKPREELQDDQSDDDGGDTFRRARWPWRTGA